MKEIRHTSKWQNFPQIKQLTVLNYFITIVSYCFFFQNNCFEKKV